jgi:hypothetical protein
MEAGSGSSASFSSLRRCLDTVGVAKEGKGGENVGLTEANAGVLGFGGRIHTGALVDGCKAERLSVKWRGLRTG